MIFRFGRERLSYWQKINKTILLKGVDLKSPIYVPQKQKDLNVKNVKIFNAEALFLESIMPKKDSSLNIRFPYIVANSAVYSNGDLIPLVPDVLNKLGVIGIKSPKYLNRKKKNTRKFNDGIPLAFALAASSAFPGMLPAQNLMLKEDKFMKIFDGGLRDNLGVSTLSQLLNYDVLNTKSAIIVNSSGSGIDEPFSENKKIKLINFLQKSSLYPVEININHSKNNLDSIFSNVNKIYLELSEFKNQIDKNDSLVRQEIESIKLISKCEKCDYCEECKYFDKSFYTWDNFSQRLSSTHSKSLNFEKLSKIKKEDFGKMGNLEKFLLYEITSQVETKLKIEEYEKEALILVGRMMVASHQDKIKMLVSPTN